MTGGKIDESIVIDALRYHLSAEKIDKDVPSEIKLPNDRKRKISYEKIQSKDEEGKIQIRPVMEIIIQQIFGCFETPKILGTPVLLTLLYGTAYTIMLILCALVYRKITPCPKSPAPPGSIWTAQNS